MLEDLWGRGGEGCGEGRVDWRDTYDYLTKPEIQVCTALLPKAPPAGERLQECDEEFGP